MPALAPDRISIGPLHAGVLDLVGKPEYRGDAGKRGRGVVANFQSITLTA